MICAACRLLKPNSNRTIPAEIAMALQEEDKEDLMRDAVALRNRIEWAVPDEPHAVVTGLRSDRSLSVFFGQDPVFHFNPDGQLRRAFVNGFLYRSQGTTLARLFRERTRTETMLVRNDLQAVELAEFLVFMRARIQNLRTALEAGTATRLRSVPDGDVPPDFSVRLQCVLQAVPQLAAPFPTRRT